MQLSSEYILPPPERRGMTQLEFKNLNVICDQYEHKLYKVNAYMQYSCLAPCGTAWLCRVLTRGKDKPCPKVFTLTGTDTNALRRRIQKTKDAEGGNQPECAICRCVRHRTISCNKCGSEWCFRCHIEILKSNRGMIKCPFCRFEFGIPGLSDAQVELVIAETLLKMTQPLRVVK